MLRIAGILLGCAMAAGSLLGAPAKRPLIVTTADHSIAEADDCEHFHTRTFTSLPAEEHLQEQREVPVTGIDLLKVRASEEGGISIKGWDRPNAKLIVCKSAVALTKQQAQKVLTGISVAVTNGEIHASGPEINASQVWWVHMLLYVPKKANLDLESQNGGIAIRNMNSHVTARATNGGISVAQCAGDHKVQTENGGISLDKVTGHVEATTQNGPISLKLRDTPLPSLEARTDDEGEIVCNLKGCADRLGNWTPNRKVLRIGAAGTPPSIRLSTTGAPIMIEQVR